MSNIGLADPRSDNRPLSDQELQLMQRLFSDPLSIPMVFKTWMVNWLEISDMKLPMAAVIGLTTTLGLDPGMSGALGMLSTASCILYAGTDTPDNTLLANGAVYATTSYPELASKLGATGSTFAVPNIPAPVAGTKWVIVT